MRLRRRLHRKKLSRPGAASPGTPQDEILTGIPVEPTEEEKRISGKSTLVEARAVSDPMLKPPPGLHEPVESQEETQERPVLRSYGPDSNAETEGALDADLKEPPQPEKLVFSCPCGARLVATKKAYDKRLRCGACKTLMLVSLVWDPDQRSYEIVPFRVENLPDVEA